MAKSKEELLEKLSECVVEMEDEEVVDVAKEYLDEGQLAFDGIMDGLVEGMNEASKLYDEISKYRDSKYAYYVRIFRKKTAVM